MAQKIVGILPNHYIHVLDLVSSHKKDFKIFPPCFFFSFTRYVWIRTIAYRFAWMPVFQTEKLGMVWG